MNAEINEGDRVEVCFSTHPSIVGTVKHIAMATGDSWIILTDDNKVYYVQQFDYIFLLVSGD